jgi:hypothetical protein
MGRLTPSFRTIYSEVLDDLRKEMRNCFVDMTLKEAFDLLYKGKLGDQMRQLWGIQLFQLS